MHVRSRSLGDVARDVPAGAEWRVSGVLRLTAGAAARSTGAARDARRAPAHGRCRCPRARKCPTAPRGWRCASRRRPISPTAEQTIRRASYKDTDAKVARFNRRISLPISIALLRTPLTANQLSVILVALGFWSAWLFSTGHYWSGVLGGFLSLAASVLDGCDGEIARLKYQESALGCWIETVRRLLVLHRDLPGAHDRLGPADRLGRVLLVRRRSRCAERC